MVKKILSILTWVVTAAGIIVLFVFSRNSYLETPLKSISLSIERSKDEGFLTRKKVIADIAGICDTTGRSTVNSVDMVRLEYMLKSSPWTKSATSFIDLDGRLVVKVKEYEAATRVFNESGSSVYVTEDGDIIPTSLEYTPRVLVASGNFDFPVTARHFRVSDSIYAQSGIDKVLKINKEIKKDKFLTAVIGQIYRNPKGIFELSVNGIESRVILGDDSDTADKLLRLKLFLKQKSGSKELTEIRKMDLQFKNQLVCTKNKQQ